MHIAWARCSFADRTRYTGKEGFPTVVYEVTSDHLRRIQSVSCGFAGTINDKTISRLDNFLQNLKVQPAFTTYQFPLYTGNGSETEDVLGAYVIVDGGYAKWRCVRSWEFVRHALFVM